MMARGWQVDKCRRKGERSWRIREGGRRKEERSKWIRAGGKRK
jgi:hypothetical protein